MARCYDAQRPGSATRPQMSTELQHDAMAGFAASGGYTARSNSKETINELHLFAGAGGGILGGILCGHRPVCAVEIEPHNRAILLARQRDGILPWFPIWDDVRTFDGKPWRGIVQCVCGGFPCQDISAAGRGAGITGESSGLWKEMARIVGEIRPRNVLVENSPLLVQRGLATVLSDLAAMGYDAQWGVVGANAAGLLHKRERIWIVADSEGFAGRDKPENPCDGLARRRGNEPTSADENAWVDVATELCGMADGVAGRVDRLFSVGNGQVPAVVAIAWRECSAV